MSISEWRKKYVDRLMEHGVWRELAEKSFEIGKGQHDYSYSPEDAADKEISYWID